jgi:uncharacterized repeat protein (TIGR03803 family)
LEGKHGDFYGTTSSGGYYQGTVFKIDSEGSLIWSFWFSGGDGAFPAAELVQGEDGDLYGTTISGGIAAPIRFGGRGTVFRITEQGRLVWSARFNGTNGNQPGASLAEGLDNNFYGCTPGGGVHDLGTVYRVSPEGAITSLYSFTGLGDGALPAGLLRAADGNFYGVASLGGRAQARITLAHQVYGGFGTVFKMTPAGTLTTVYAFGAVTNQSGYPLDGAVPVASVIQGKDGDFYGTTVEGGAGRSGTLFKLTPEGVLATLHSFSELDGAVPAARLLQDPNGDFYGTTVFGGPRGNIYLDYGTVFKLSNHGVFTSLAWLDGTNGAFPSSGLVRGKYGDLYGTTQGGYWSAGTIFRLSISERDQPVP